MSSKRGGKKAPPPPPPEESEDDEAATRPGAPLRRSIPVAVAGPVAVFGVVREDSSEDDPATVRADRQAIMRALHMATPDFGALSESEGDPATVQRPSRTRLPPSKPSSKRFGSESEGDPATMIYDPEGDDRWRGEIDDHVDEVPPGPLPPGPLPPAFQDRSSTTLARAVSQSRAPAPRVPEPPSESRVGIWLPVLGGAAGGVLILALVMAWLAGSP